MREIKFRAYNKLEREMQTVLNVGFFYGEEMIISADSDDGQKDYYEEKLKDIVLMQYTGLKDKNGKEIYEGDILKTPVWVKNVGLGVCIFNQENNVNFISGFGIYTKDSYYNRYQDLVCSDEWDEFEVIGNIYENPELLN